MSTSTRRLVALVWPLFLELSLGSAVGLIGTALAAHQSDAAGAAFAITNHVFVTLFMLFRVIGAGVSVVLTQCLGGGRRDEADRVARAALGASTWIGGLGAFLALAGATPLLQLVNAPADILPLAAPFLMALAPAIMLDAWNATLTAVVRSHLYARDALGVIMLMHTCHVLLALWFMGGGGPVPPLGLTGFALAMLASRVLGLSLNLALWRWRLGLVPRWGDAWRLPRAPLAAVLHIGLPGAAENLAWRMGFMASVGAAGHLGALALATQGYVLQIMYAILLFGAAVGFGVEIVVGHLIGAGELHQARQLVGRALGWGLASSTLLASLAALNGHRLLGWFTADPEIIANGTTLLWLTVALESGRTFNMVVINALRASGDARYPLLAGLGSVALVLAGGSWVLGVGLGWGLPGIWLAYAADEWLRGLLMWRRWARLGWVPFARSVHRRLRLSHPLAP